MQTTSKIRNLAPGCTDRIYYLLKRAGYPKFGTKTLLAEITGMHVNGVRRFLGEDRLPNGEALQRLVAHFTADIQRLDPGSKFTSKEILDYLSHGRPIGIETEIYSSVDSIDTLLAGRIVLLVKQLADSHQIDVDDPDTAGRIHLIQDRLIKYHQKNPQIEVDSDDFLYVAKSLILLLKTDPGLMILN